MPPDVVLKNSKVCRHLRQELIHSGLSLPPLRNFSVPCPSNQLDPNINSVLRNIDYLTDFCMCITWEAVSLGSHFKDWISSFTVWSIIRQQQILHPELIFLKYLQPQQSTQGILLSILFKFKCLLKCFSPGLIYLRTMRNKTHLNHQHIEI